MNNQENISLYIKIISLNEYDMPQETIEGRTTGGTINVDGSSAVRRTCSLSFTADLETTTITDIYWTFNTKFKILLGKEDYENKNIKWYEYGIFIITSFSASKNTTSISISLQGKDKMCRLNGDVGGNIAADTDFGTIEITESDNLIRLQKLPIRDIIRNAIKSYGQERDENIVIKDLDINGYELWEYRGNEPIYYFMQVDTGEIIYITLEQDIELYYKNENNVITSSKISNINKYYSTNTLDKTYNQNATKAAFTEELYQQGELYYIIKIDSFETAGYHPIELVYNTDLILKAGETIETLLNKLCQMLGDFEYFYDVYGRFVFQKKKTYIQELFSTSTGALTTPMLYNEMYSYIFEDESLFTSVSLSPNINNIKNDFVVWGQRKSNDQQLPIHARCAIDKKPEKYVSPWQSIIYSIDDYDWRELIYQMAIDYLYHNQESNFLIELQKKNPSFMNGQTGYEQYYTDIHGFWRQLYDPSGSEEQYYKEGEYRYWNKNIHLDPNLLNFWFEFLDTTGDLNEYSVKKIGSRSKVVNESSVTSIYYKETPEICFVLSSDNIQQRDLNTMYSAQVQITENSRDLFAKSSQGISAIEKINELVRSNTAIAFGLNLTTLPILELLPNTRIKINNIQCAGDYTLDKISINLSYNSTMQLNLTRIFEQFI